MTSHQRALLQLLPEGTAWNKSPETLLAALCGALSQSSSRATAISQQLLKERFPSQAWLLLEDWEHFLGLPGCDTGQLSVTERQHYAANKLRMKPSLNREFYIELAAQYGFSITIENAPDNQWISVIRVKNFVRYRNMTVLDTVLTPLRIYETGVLECVLNHYQPAHQEFRYVYDPGYRPMTVLDNVTTLLRVYDAD